MMMCIGSVRDFEAQIDRSVDRFMRGRSAEEAELVTRSWDWLYARQYVDGSFDRLAPAAVEPSRPYSNGRRFIPAWLAEERELSMADGFSDDIGRTYSDLGSQARGFYHQTWIATFGSSVLRGRKLDHGEHYDGNFGLHGTIGTWLA